MKELATVIDENADVLSAALEVLKSFDMIHVSENGIPYIKNYSEFQWGDESGEESPATANSAVYEKIERRKEKDRERKRSARAKSKVILSQENEDADSSKTSADTVNNSAELPDLSADASADTEADISEIPFIYIRGEEIREDKNRIDNSLREERRDLPPSGREVDCEPKPHASSSTAVRSPLPEGAKQEPANSTLCDSVTDCEPKPHASSSTAMRSPLPEGAINTPTPINEGRGIYKNVFISDKEYRALKERYPDSIDRLIEELSTYLKSSGKSYESHSATLSRWAIRDRREKEAYGGKNGFHNSSECGVRQNTPSGDSPKGGKEEPRLRYGDFDPEEAFQRAVARSLATKIGEQASVPPYSP